MGEAAARATYEPPACTITTPHSHSSLDDPITCPVRDRATSGRITKRMVDGYVSRYLTPAGVKKWWERPVMHLGGRSPLHAWADGDRRAVLDYAVGGMDQGGS